IHMDHFDDKIAIIGGGPAGLSAAYYLAERGYRPTLFEKNEFAGGMLRYGIPSYKLEKDVIEAEIDVMRQMGVDIRTGVEVGRDVTLDSLRKEGYKAFYIAIGCSAGRRPGVPGDDAEGTFTAIDYLHDANCGDREFTGRVVVVGGGNVAIDASRVSARNGASSVIQLCLESKKEMPASLEEITEAGEDGVTIKCGWGPKEVLVTDGKVSGIVFKKCTSVKNAEGRFAPSYDENETITLDCDRVIFAVGQASVWGDLVKNENVEFNGPAIVVDRVTYQTTQPDIFVGGDVYTGPKFAIDAIAAGKIAAESLHRYVHNAHMKIGRNRWEFNELDKDNISVESYDNASRQEAGMDSQVPAKSFRDAHRTLTEEQVKIETSRCLGCGASIVDENKCIGCGICTTKCEFDAIHLYREFPEASTMIKAEDKFKAILPYAAKAATKKISIKKKG
ncbi:MAG: FAD-dependent oxidoreductase, partial [Holdemanella sp.]|nr:FAD-dependent oxidoreductase [Holdemanella sp.]